MKFGLILSEVLSSGEEDNLLLRKKCPYSELFWFVFSRIRTEYGYIRCISPYSVQMWENADQNQSEYGPYFFVLSPNTGKCEPK